MQQITPRAAASIALGFIADDLLGALIEAPETPATAQRPEGTLRAATMARDPGTPAQPDRSGSLADIIHLLNTAI